MKDTYSIAEIGRNPAAALRQASAKGAITICRDGKAVGFLLSRDRMEAIIETLEIMSNPNAMKAIRSYQAGKVKMQDVSVLDED